MTTTRMFLFAILAACGSASQSAAPVSARQFDTSCTADADCVAIYEGPCQPCACANAAINRSQLASYEAFVQANAACFDATKCGADCIDVAGATGPNVTCVAGTCKYASHP